MRRSVRAARLALGLAGWLALPHVAHAQNTPSPRTKTTPAPLHSLLQQKLRDALTAIDRRLDGALGVAIIDLTSGERLLVNADHVFPTASAIKAPILAELLRQSQDADSGRPGARLGDTYVPRPEDVIADSPILGGLRLGASRLTNQDLATFMIVVSDNGATNLLIDRVGRDAVNTTLARLGLRETRLRRKMLDGEAVKRGLENTATAAELALFYERLYAGQLLDETHRALLWRILELPKSGYLTTELPDDPALRIAHKPGSLDGARIDAGIVFVPGRPFAIAALVSFAADGRAAEQAIAEIGRRAYDYFSRVATSTPYGRRAPK